MFMSGRTSLFLGRSPTAGKAVVNAGLIDSNKKLYEDVVRRGFHQYEPPRAVEQPHKDVSEEGRVFIFRNPTNGSVVDPTKSKGGRAPSMPDFNKTNPLPHRTVPAEGMRPPDNGVLMLYNQDESMRVNPHSYNLILDEPQACFDASGSPKDVYLLVLIATIHKNFEQRRAIRETWGSPREVDGKAIVTFFLLAHNEDASLQRRVEDECSEHHDLLQEDFVDTYKNLTLKTIMGMKWASTHCPHASYVMKTDDDMYVSYANLVKHLSSSQTPSADYAVGFLINGSPIRDRKSKWYMPKEVYAGSRYPPFLSGTGYVMSADVAGKIYGQSLDTKYLHLEDVFVAVCFKALGVVPVKNKEFNNWRTVYSYCRFRRLITTHMVPPTEMHRIWKDQQRQRSVSC